MTFKIEKEVKIPKKIHHGRVSKYPWPDMEVGDSFFAAVRTSSALLSSASQWADKNNLKRKFTVRKEGKHFRIWRIS